METISALIETEVINKCQAILCTSVFEFYKSEFVAQGETSDDIKCYRTQPLVQKIKEKFGNKMSISLYNNRKGNSIYNSNMSAASAQETLQKEDEMNLHIIRSAELHL